MNELKIGFTKTENAILQSEQLTRSEKWFYVALKSFRHNSPPIRCNPSLPQIEKRAGLSHPTVLKIRKLLEIKGLIKIESKGAGAGRTKTNNYIFPLEVGTDEDKQRLLAFLRVKKNGTKLNRFRRKKTVKKKTVLSEKNGLEFNEKTVKKKTPNKKVLTRSKKQQQGKEKKPVVASLSLNKKKEKPVVKDNLDSLTPILTARLRKIHITEDKAKELLANHLYSNIATQLEWLPYRKDIKNPAGALIKAVEQGWPEPPGYPKKSDTQRTLEEMRERSKALLRIAKKDLKTRASEERAKEWEDKLEVPEYKKKLREFLKKEGYRGIAEKLSWKESDKYRGLYSRAKEELNHGAKAKRDIPGKTQRHLGTGGHHRKR